MDRLWDVWTRKQQRLKLPYLPQGADLKTFSDEPFLFYADGKGGYVGPSKAGDYISTDRFDYDYAPGFGEDIVNPPAVASAPQAKPQQGSVKANVGTVRIPGDALEAHLAAARPQPLMAQITLPRPSGYSTVREFDVLVNAPANVTKVTADSPYYAGTIAFFGSMMPGMAMTMDATFAVPLPTKREAFSALRAAPNQPLSIRVVPSGGVGTAPTLKALSVGPLRP